MRRRLMLQVGMVCGALGQLVEVMAVRAKKGGGGELPALDSLKVASVMVASTGHATGVSWSLSLEDSVKLRY